MLNVDSVSSQLEWLTTLSIPPKVEAGLTGKNLRKTSIIATIGPKTNSVEMISKLRTAGVNVVRMNFSHGSYEYHQSVIDNTRKAEASAEGRPLAIALDTKGPEIRTGNMVNDEDVKIPAGHRMLFSTDPKYATACTDKVYFIDYANLPKVIEVGKPIYIDDGVMSFRVLSIEGTNVHVEAINAGTLSSKKGVNLPGTDVDLPAISQKDKDDLSFGVKNGVDMVFASFIRRGQDVKDIRAHLGEAGKNIKIIVKIENLQGVANFDEILKETDGVMVARGDLGIEIPASQVFMAQKMMIAKCNLAGKPSICATQMLESMTYNPRPTRAEVSDVANAVIDGADCVMLSGETAKGTYPIAAVEMMAETCFLAESAICYPPLFNEIRNLAFRPTATSETVAMSAVAAALEQNAGAILVMSTSGNTARLISKYRPPCPVITITRNAQTARQVHLHRGCYPMLYEEPRPSSNEGWQTDIDNRIRYGLSKALELGVLKKGDTIVAIQGWRAGGGSSNTMRVLSVPTHDDGFTLKPVD
ncbi:pyruvate kinase [Microbotryum lychnidis-dioicae p1A1 Lamole]|uniref:Pyruvate kinase n=1 Tax=Microbotryum lychnidis-dioicae (strain p1A1 Lamole / MvSl-1064) TaxID=683840 RepID=U5H7T0_USTV1|nr:pyruvate kinase [Microbotryum lychnidis-dioicae p1A1 Lamole]|eukprot:KDE06394.1 pyruvate kinase [Microbotryum lychnidis-dioicae p1A1 Lamole]